MYKRQFKDGVKKPTVEEIIICCHEISDEVMSLANSIKGQKSFLLASKDGEMFKLDTKEKMCIRDRTSTVQCRRTANGFRSAI